MSSAFSIVQWITSHRNPFIYFATCLSIPSTVLYIAEMITIVRNRSLHNSFYALFFTRAVCDLLYLFASFYGYRLPVLFPSQLWSFYSALPNWALALFPFLSHYSMVTDYLATLFILLNRLTAIVFPFTCEKLWLKFLPFVLLVIAGVPMYACNLLKLQMSVLANMKNTTEREVITEFSIVDSNKNSLGADLALYMRINLFNSILFFSFSILLNLAIVYAYRQRMRRIKVPPTRQGQDSGSQPAGRIKQPNNPLDKFEMKLLVYTFLTLVGHMLISLLMIGFGCLGPEDMQFNELLNALYPLVVDLGSVVLPSWLLLWASPSFRGKMERDFLPQSWRNCNRQQPAPLFRVKPKPPATTNL